MCIRRNTRKADKDKGYFLMGVFTCFRVQQLLNLSEDDLVIRNSEYYINTVVQKTKKTIQIKLNPIGKYIVDKYRKQYDKLLPSITEQRFNENLKDLASYFKGYIQDLKRQRLVTLISNNWESNFRRIRTKRGLPQFEMVAPEKYISSHVMRRSGINFLLMAGMSAFEVQSISGHSLNSRDFATYVKIASSEVEKKSVNAWNSVLM